MYGVDIEPTMVTYLARRAEAEGLANLSAHLGAPDDPRIAALPRTPDLVFVCNTYHHIDDRVGYFRRVAEALAVDARLAIVDFRPDSEMGPPAPMKMAAEQVIDELGDAGWRLQTHHDALAEQYVLVFAR